MVGKKFPKLIPAKGRWPFLTPRSSRNSSLGIRKPFTDLRLNSSIFWLSLILFLVLLLRIPTLFEPHRYADEEIYLTLGLGLRKGLTLYKDIHDNKPPLLYFVAALAGNVFWLRFFLLIWHSLTVVVFWKLTKTLLKNAHLGIIGLTTLIFAILTTIPLLEGNIANGEIFMIGPAIFGAYLIWQNRQKWKARALLVAGFSFSLAFLFKVPIAFDFAGLVAFLLFTLKGSLRQKVYSFFSLRFLYLVGGFLLPIVISIVYYSLQGVFELYVKAALLQNISYLSSWETGKTISSAAFLSGGFSQRGIFLLILMTLLLTLKKWLSQAGCFLSCWFIFSLFGALLSGRPYPHYLLEPIAPAMLLATVIFWEKGWVKIYLLCLLLLLPLSAWYYKFWYYKSLPYYQNFLEYVSGKKDKTQYFAFFEGGVNRNYQVAEYLVKHTLPEERIFVWGTEPAIYSLSQRLPVGRYTVSYHIADFNAWEEIISNLEKEKPKTIVKMTNEPKKFPALESLLNYKYAPMQAFNEAVIYRKLY